MRSLVPFNVSPKTIINSEEFFEDFFHCFLIEKSFSFNFSPQDFKVDLLEDEYSYFIEAELPGVYPKDLEVSYINSFLLISAFKKGSEKNYIQKEIEQGSFRRMFYVENINENSIKISYSLGVLSIMLPKS